jgi:hypothetical protein
MPLPPGGESAVPALLSWSGAELVVLPRLSPGAEPGGKCGAGARGGAAATHRGPRGRVHGPSPEPGPPMPSAGRGSCAGTGLALPVTEGGSRHGTDRWIVGDHAPRGDGDAARPRLRLRALDGLARVARRPDPLPGERPPRPRPAHRRRGQSCDRRGDVRRVPARPARHLRPAVPDRARRPRLSERLEDLLAV